MLMLEEDIDEMIERRITEGTALLQEVFVEASVIIVYHLRDFVCNITSPRLPFLPARPLTCDIIIKACS